MRSPKPQRQTTSSKQQCSGRSRHPTNSPYRHHTILKFLYLDLNGKRDGFMPWHRSISLLLDLLVLGSPPPIHLHFRVGHWTWVGSCSCLNLDLTLYSTLLYFTFFILSFIGYLLVLLPCNDIIVLSIPPNLPF